MWRWQREAVADEYDVIAPDNRGTGRSDVGLPPLVARLPGTLRALVLLKLAGYSMGGLAADLEAVLDDAGIYDAHIVGASMGGMIAQRYALEYSRTKSLTLCCTSHGAPTRHRCPRRPRNACSIRQTEPASGRRSATECAPRSTSGSPTGTPT